jgi:hypothetical protein
MLLTGRAEGWSQDASMIAMIGLCLIITYIAMRAADVLVWILGQTGPSWSAGYPAYRWQGLPCNSSLTASGADFRLLPVRRAPIA